jgi:hypothetical protein
MSQCLPCAVLLLFFLTHGVLFNLCTIPFHSFSGIALFLSFFFICFAFFSISRRVCLRASSVLACVLLVLSACSLDRPGCRFALHARFVTVFFYLLSLSLSFSLFLSLSLSLSLSLLLFLTRLRGISLAHACSQYGRSAQMRLSVFWFGAGHS